MARSDSVTILPLDRYSNLMSIPSTHFNQLWGEKAPFGTGCDNDVWDQDGRDLLAWTMQQAEELISTELGTLPAPAFITDEEIMMALTGVRADWWTQAELATKYGIVAGYGTEELTLVLADATVEYLNLDNDPFDREETAEIGGLVYEDLPACTRRF